MCSFHLIRISFISYRYSKCCPLIELLQVVNIYDDYVSTNNVKFYFDYQNGKYGWNSSSLRGADTFSPFRITPTDTYAFDSNTGDTVDLGEDHTYRYVNATNVYNKGKSDNNIKITGASSYQSSGSISVKVGDYVAVASPAAISVSGGSIATQGKPSGVNIYLYIIKASATTVSVSSSSNKFVMCRLYL